MIRLRVPSSACALMYLLLVSGAAVHAASSEWEPLSTQALRNALVVSHPEVTNWNITALTSQRLQQRLAERVIARVEVAHIGKRSAVHLWCAAGALRPCATVWFAVSGMQPVLSSLRELAQARSVVAADFAVQEHDVMNLHCMPLSSSEGLESMRTTQRVSANTAVCREYFEPRPLVSRGETVSVRAAAGAIAVMARAIAQQDGVLGQVVAVKLVNQSESVDATVTGVGRVAVDESHE